MADAAHQRPPLPDPFRGRTASSTAEHPDEFWLGLPLAYPCRLATSALTESFEGTTDSLCSPPVTDVVGDERVDDRRVSREMPHDLGERFWYTMKAGRHSDFILCGRRLCDPTAKVQDA
jgi:hypothetical protein